MWGCLTYYFTEGKDSAAEGLKKKKKKDTAPSVSSVVLEEFLLLNANGWKGQRKERAVDFVKR